MYTNCSKHFANVHNNEAGLQLCRRYLSVNLYNGFTPAFFHNVKKDTLY